MTLLRLAAGTLCLLYPLADCWLKIRCPQLAAKARAVPLIVYLAVYTGLVMLDDRTATHLGHLDPWPDGGPTDGTLPGVVAASTAWKHYREELLRRGRADRTISDYRQVIWDFWAFLAPRKAWHRANPDPGRDLDRFLDRPVRRGRRKGQPLTQDSRAHYSKVLIDFYRWAAGERLGPQARPWLKARSERQADPRPRAIPLQEVAGLLRQLDVPADPACERAHLAVALGYYALLRVGAIAALDRTDCHLRAVPPVLRCRNKGGGGYDQPIHPDLLPILRRYLARHPGSGPLLDNFARPGHRLTPQGVSKLISRAMHAAGIDESAHALRHTGASELLVALDGRERPVQEALNHKSSTTVRRYTLAFRQRELHRYLRQLPDPLAPAAPAALAVTHVVVDALQQLPEEACRALLALLPPDVAQRLQGGGEAIVTT